MLTERQLTALARKAFQQLKRLNTKIVLAESCTGGLASALLTRIPGVSQFHCGSAVAYQLATKQEWLRVPASLLRNPGPVSREVALRMALEALAVTPHADVSAAVTGHLGPGAPASQDGRVYVAFARRGPKGRKTRAVVRKVELAGEPGDEIKNPELRRLGRQRAAAAHLIGLVIEQLTPAEGFPRA